MVAAMCTSTSSRSASPRSTPAWSPRTSPSSWSAGSPSDAPEARGAIGDAPGAQGIRVSCQGRLGGAEIARGEWYREGRVPLHARRRRLRPGRPTPYGTNGVKVWVFKARSWSTTRRRQAARQVGVGADVGSCAMMQPKRTKYHKRFKGRKGPDQARRRAQFRLLRHEGDRQRSCQRARDRGGAARDPPHLKRVGQVWIRTSRRRSARSPPRLRIGKGKGSVEYWVVPVKAGRIMFEIDGVPAALAEEAIRRGGANAGAHALRRAAGETA